MQPLLHSPFLQALGYSIVNSLWQFAFLWLLYFALNTLFKLSSHQKYIAGFTFEIVGFIWFLATLAVYYNQSLLLSVYSQDSQPYFPVFSSYPATTIRQQFFLLLIRSEQFFPYLSVAYLALAFILALRWIYAYNFTSKVRLTGLKKIDDDWRFFVHNLSLQIGIKRTVGIFLSELVQTPMTIGFFKPIILIPLATINYLDAHQMEAVIVHELAHIKRYDYLFNLLLAVVEACLFFNPFMRLIHQQVKKERENCCDDWVLKYKYSATSYARALLKIASNQTHTPLLVMNATDDKKLLVTRIKRIIEKNEHAFFNYQHQLLALLVLTTVFSALSFLTPAKKIVHSLNVGVRPIMVSEPMAAKVENPLFNPAFFLADTSNMVVAATEPAEVKVVKTKTGGIREGTVCSPSATLTPADLSFASPVGVDKNDEIVERFAHPSTPVVAPHFIVGSQPTLLKDEVAKVWDKTPSIELNVERWVQKEGAKQMEMAQNQISRERKGGSQENDLIFNLGKLKARLSEAIDQLKSSKKQIELNQLQSLVRLNIKKIRKETASSFIQDESLLQLSELESLQNKIDSEISSFDQPSFFSTHLDVDDKSSVEVPTVVYYLPKEKAHNFSFQYSTAAPTPAIPRHLMKEEENNSWKNENILITNAEEAKTKVEVAPAPPARAAHTRAFYIIKI